MKTSGMRMAARVLLQALIIASGLAASGAALAANYPLELVSPRAVGTSPASGWAQITAGNRIFKAYPGLEYNIRAVVTGGAYPYEFSLSNAPAGMTINPVTGLIVWPNPQANAAPTITVTDAEGTRASSSWAITVTTSGFRFVDSVNGRAHPTGTGTAANPWRNISDVRNASAPGEVVYFRNGTYDALDIPRSGIGGVWQRVEFNSGYMATSWLAYPGANPVINFGFVPGGELGVLIRFNGANIYVDGFETRNSRIIGFQTGSEAYKVFRRLRMRDHNAVQANLDGTNASYIMTLGGNESLYGDYMAVQDCDFSDAPLDMGLKIYSQRKLVIENNVFSGMMVGTELKADAPQFTYRANRHHNIVDRAIGGNMHNTTTYGEINFNLVDGANSRFALDVNQDGMARRIDIYRNTFVGRVRVRNTDAADGPFRFYNNVIVNSDSGTPSGSHIYFEGVDGARVTSVDNLAGYPSGNIVDASGNLASGYLNFLGTRGYQIGEATAPPSPPANVTVE